MVINDTEPSSFAASTPNTNHKSGFPKLSDVIAEMHRRYAMEGMEILGSFAHTTSLGGISGTGTQYVAEDAVVLSSSGGISLDEELILFGICEILRPADILVIGNSYGISTLFLALSNPESTLVAIDKFRTEGINVTNKLLKGAAKMTVVQASTPDDLEALVSEFFPDGLDLVLLDAVHENDIQTREYEILRPHMRSGGAIVMHDVLSCDLLPSYSFLRDKYTDDHFVLCSRSTSGLAVSEISHVPETRELKNRGLADSRLIMFLKTFATEMRTVLAFQTLVAESNWYRRFSSRLDDSEPRELEFPPHPQI